MSFDTKSEYALGKKNKTAIICQDAYGNITALTQDDFESQKEFRKWRNWNIMKSHTVEKKEHIHRNYTLSMTGFEEYLSNLPVQDAAATSEDTPSEAAPEVIVAQIKELLTPTQFRRLWLHEVDGLSLTAIAEQEGVAVASVRENILASKKKVLKHFRKHP